MEEVLSDKTSEEWSHLLQDAGVAAGPVNTAKQVNLIDFIQCILDFRNCKISLLPKHFVTQMPFSAKEKSSYMYFKRHRSPELLIFAVLSVRSGEILALTGIMLTPTPHI